MINGVVPKCLTLPSGIYIWPKIPGTVLCSEAPLLPYLAAVAKDVKRRRVVSKQMQADGDLPKSKAPSSDLGAEVEEVLKESHLVPYRETPEEVWLLLEDAPIFIDSIARVCDVHDC